MPGRLRDFGELKALWIPRPEASAERQIEVHPLHALLGLHPDERGLRGVQRELAVRDISQVGAAYSELRLNDVERTLVVGEGLGEDALALPGSALGGQRGLDLAERPQADRG